MIHGKLRMFNLKEMLSLIYRIKQFSDNNLPVEYRVKILTFLNKELINIKNKEKHFLILKHYKDNNIIMPKA